MTHTIIATDHKSTEYYIVNNATYTHTLRVNGDRVVTFDIEYTDNNAVIIEKIGRRWKFYIDNGKSRDEYIVQNVYEDTDGDDVKLSVDCLYVSYDELKREMLTTSYTGSQTRDQWFNWLFKGSKYKIDMQASPQLALTIDNFGYDSRLALLFQLMDKFDLEFYITGKTIHVVDSIGEDKQDYISYGVNLIDLSRESQFGDFGTYGTLIGALKNEEKPELGRYEATYTHELSKEYGLIPIKPIVDERFKILDAMKDEIKKQIEASIVVSLEAKVDDIIFTQKDAEIFEGDTIRFMDERMGIYTDIRIVEVKYTHNDLGELLDTTYVLGDYAQQYSSNKADLDIKNQVNKDLPNKIEAGNKNIIKDTEDKLAKLYKEYEEKYNELKEGTQEAIEIAGRGGKIFRQILEPKGSDLNQGDLWYKPKWLGGTTGWETEMYQYEKDGNIGQWRRIMDVEIGDAGRLQKGTINAKVINLINLNADEIVAGTIRGKNLKIDLDRGLVEFTKGKIYKADNSFEINIDDGRIHSKSPSFNTWFNLARGEITLSTTLGGSQLGRIGAGKSIGSQFGLVVEGEEHVTVSTGNYSKVPVIGEAKGAGMYMLGAKSNDPNHGRLYAHARNGMEFVPSSGKKAVVYIDDDVISMNGFGMSGHGLTIGMNSPLISLSAGTSSLIGGNNRSAHLRLSATNRVEISGENGTSVRGDFNVTGKKNAIHVTRDGVRETPAYEMATAFIGDIGEVTTSPSGMAIVEIPDIFYDIANFDKDYQVFLTPYDFCQFRVTDRTNNSFIIETDKGNCRIGYEIKALRRGYEDEWFHKADDDYKQVRDNFTDIPREEINNV